MNNGADDRRVRKTKKALRQGLVSLLEKKKLKDITVRELTDTVDLHRGTFYVHYRDIYELRERGKVLVRVIFTIRPNGEIVLLHAFVKRQSRDTMRALEQSLSVLTQLMEHPELVTEYKVREEGT